MNHILQNKESGTNATNNIEPIDLHHDNKDKPEVSLLNLCCYYELIFRIISFFQDNSIISFNTASASTRLDIKTTSSKVQLLFISQIIIFNFSKLK